MDIIGEIIRREGGYVDHAADRGGPTKFGITQATLSDWLGRQASVEDVRGLGEATAREIYQKQYVTWPSFDRIADERLRELVIDSGVNCGTTRAAKWLQEAVSVAADGKIGPQTLAAVNGANPQVLFRRVLALRIKHYGRLITNDPKQSAFAAGWANRVAEFLEA